VRAALEAENIRSAADWAHRRADDGAARHGMSRRRRPPLDLASTVVALARAMLAAVECGQPISPAQLHAWHLYLRRIAQAGCTRHPEAPEQSGLFY
jgi:hypothetical protein